MHESTVSRVTNEKYVQTPRGVLPLKFFFSSALSTAGGEDVSAARIKARSRSWSPRRTRRSRSPTSRSCTCSRSRASRSPAARSPSTATSSASCRRACGSGYDARRRPTDVDVSVLVPAKDEAENLPEFVRLCAEALRPRAVHVRGRRRRRRHPRRQRARCCASCAAQYPFLRVVTTARQRGIADALRTAGDVGRGATCSCSIPPTCSTCPRTSRARGADPRRRGRHGHRHQAGEVREGASSPASTTGCAAGSSACR